MASLYGSQRGTREIALTFDDGPHPIITPRILDILGERGLKAVFFVLGEKLESAEGKRIMRRAFEEGHTIANHTYSHPQLPRLSDDEIREELRRTQELIGDCGCEPKLFRPPYGATNSRVDRVVHDAGYISVLWNVDPEDWARKSEDWVHHCMGQVERREDSIIVMHDVHRTTADHLRKMLDRAEALGEVEFVSYA